MFQQMEMKEGKWKLANWRRVLLFCATIGRHTCALQGAQPPSDVDQGVEGGRGARRRAPIGPWAGGVAGQKGVGKKRPGEGSEETKKTSFLYARPWSIAARGGIFYPFPRRGEGGNAPPRAPSKASHFFLFLRLFYKRAPTTPPIGLPLLNLSPRYRPAAPAKLQSAIFAAF